MFTKESLLLNVHIKLNEGQSREAILAFLHHHQNQKDDKKYRLFVDTFEQNITQANTEDLNAFIENSLRSCYAQEESIRSFEKKASRLTLVTRFQLIHAMIDQLKGEKDPLPYPKDSLSESCHYLLTKLNDSLKIQSNESHSQLTQKQYTLLDTILAWIREENKENLFEKETIFVQQTCSEKPLALLKNLEEKQRYYENLPSNKSDKIPKGTVDFIVYQKIVQHESISHEAIATSIKTQLKRELALRKEDYDKKRLQESRDVLYEHLINDQKKKKSHHNTFLKSLYDRRKERQKRTDKTLIDSYQKIWEHDKSIQKLAESLGRRTQAKVSYEKKIINQEIIEKIPVERPTSKGQISGIGQSNDLSSLIPTELLYRCSPRTKKLFDKRFIEKQLLSFHYENTLFIERKRIIKKEVTVEKIEKRGPLMLLVDTSGSMIGMGEKISKTITMALSHLALQEGRKCYLLFYSVNFTQLEIDHYEKEKLASFLRLTFEGGTDLNPALEKVTDKMKEAKWKDADILVISDFIMEGLVPRIQTKMQVLQKNGTHFFALSIGEDYNPSVLSLFNYNWAYDPIEKTIREMDTLKKSEAKQNEEKRTFQRESASALYKV